MDYDAFDRAASRAVVRITHPNGVVCYIADNEAETATDIQANVRRFNSLADAWDAVDRNAPAFRGAKLEAVSVVELWNHV